MKKIVYQKIKNQDNCL